MNEESGKGKSIIIVVLVLIILIMGGAFYYLFTNKDKIFEKCSCPEKKCAGQTVEDKKTDVSFDSKNKSKVEVVSGNYFRVYISKDGNAFLTVSEDSTPINTRAEVSPIKKLQEKYTSNKIEGYCNVEGEARKDICEDGDSVKSIKLDTSNVIAAYKIINGQEVESEYVIFLKGDGTLDVLNIGSVIYGGQDINITKNLGGLENIVTIMQTSTTGIPSGYHYGLAIEKNGKQHELTKYLTR